MSSPIFQAIGGNAGGMGGPLVMVQQFIQFANGFKGDPKQKVQELLNSGQMTQEQYNALQGPATQFQQLLGKFPGANGK